MLFMVQALKDEAWDKEGTFSLTKLTRRCASSNGLVILCKGGHSSKYATFML